jgi:outer membrane protein TolC
MKRAITSILIGVSLTITIAAQNERFNYCVDFITSNNETLKADSINTQSQILSLQQKNNLSDPELDLSHQWGQRGIGNKWSVGVSQSFEWPGVYSARKKQINAEVEALTQNLSAQENELRMNIRNALIEYIYTRKLIALYNDQLARIDSLIIIYNRGAELGEISKLDVNKLKIERIAASRQLNEAQNTLTGHQQTIKNLNGGKDCSNELATLSDFPNVEPGNVDDYIQTAQIHDPSIQALTMQSEAIRHESNVVRQSYIPSFSVGYSHDYELGEHFNGVSIGLTLPIFSNRKKKSEIASRRTFIETSQEIVQSEIHNEIKTLYRQVVNLNTEINQYRAVIEDKDNIRLLNMALDAGQITLIDYLQQVNYFQQAQADYIGIERQRAIYMSQLCRWENWN